MLLIDKINDENINIASKILADGGLVSFPTETVYGLGGDAFNTKSLAKIFEVKRRPYFDPLIVHIATLEMVEKIAFITNNELFETLVKNFWPGPLTIILPKKDIIPDLATGGLDSVAIRMPDNNIALKLIKESTGAIAAPSANPFGYLSPVQAKHVIDTIGKDIDCVIDGGQTLFGIESTVIDLTTNKPQILRYGALDCEKIEKSLGMSLEYFSNINKLKFKSPGQIKKHYSPRKPLIIWDNPEKLRDIDFSNTGALFFNETNTSLPFKAKRILTKTNNFVEAASNLFEYLHELEDEQIDKIYAEKVPESGIGKAIQDRLNRASAK